MFGQIIEISVSDEGGIDKCITRIKEILEVATNSQNELLKNQCIAAHYYIANFVDFDLYGVLKGEHEYTPGQFEAKSDMFYMVVSRDDVCRKFGYPVGDYQIGRVKDHIVASYEKCLETYSIGDIFEDVKNDYHLNQMENMFEGMIPNNMDIWTLFYFYNRFFCPFLIKRGLQTAYDIV